MGIIGIFIMANQSAAGNKTAPPKPTEKTEIKISKADRFKNLAPKRTRQVLKQLEILGNCSTRGNYEYTAENVEKIFTAIKSKLAEVEARFKPGQGPAKNTAFTLD